MSKSCAGAIEKTSVGGWRRVRKLPISFGMGFEEEGELVVAQGKEEGFESTY
jgi:hypothetical protein